MVMETEPALAISIGVASEVVSTLSSTPITWNLETGSKLNVPGPLPEKSYRADTIKQFCSTEVTNPASGFKAYHRARQSHSCRRGSQPSHSRRGHPWGSDTMGANVNIDDNAEGQEGGSTNCGTDEGNLLSILPDYEGLSGVIVVQHGPELEDLQIIIASVLDGGGDPQIRCGRDFVGGSRERKLEITTGANGGFGVSTDYGETKSDKRYEEHGDAKVSEGSWAEY